MQKEKATEKEKVCWDGVAGCAVRYADMDPDTRINSRIRVSADPPDRQMPVSAACVRVLTNLVNLGVTYPGSASICGFFLGVLGGSILSVSIRVSSRHNMVSHLGMLCIPCCSALSGCGVSHDSTM